MVEFRCPDCEKRVEAGTTVCPSCGKSSDLFVELYSDIYSRAERKKTMVNNSDSFVEYCVKCGLASNSTSYAYCSGCGNSLDAQRKNGKSTSIKLAGINGLENVETPKYKLKSIFILAGILVVIVLLVGIIFNGEGLGNTVPDQTQTTASDPISSDSNNTVAPTPAPKNGHWEQNCITVQVANPNYNPYKGFSAVVNEPTVSQQQCTQQYVQNP